ncbi:Ribosomal RNA small subunit methyltransferase E [Candidatus Magnetaquicoccaceae bacterium FCR-1]|uniref:Ribosomal RNA small subunit methyltransferase E n=1 Tax=Candidatus Magnetaquiglobus chichijimensis TaxID=3141448 RepID=A0ABQ0C8M7_9PROT
MIPRLFVPHFPRLGERMALDEAERNRLLRTLRLTRGDTVILFCGEPGEWRATIVETGPTLWVEPVEFVPALKDSPLRITLILGLTKSGAIELAVQKAVEAGVDRLIPLISRYGVCRPDARQSDNKSRRLKRIAIEAAQQCGRTRVPELCDPVGWSELPALLTEGPRLLFWESAGERGERLRVLPHPGSAVTLLIGPEGGLSAEEVRVAREELGFVIVSLGPRVLRAETAAMATVVACQVLWGDMG